MIDGATPDYRPTPTIRELYEMKDGYAEAVTFSKALEPTSFRLTPKGHAYLAAIMRQNAEGAIARRSGPADAVSAMKKIVGGGTGGKKSAWSPS